MRNFIIGAAVGFVGFLVAGWVLCEVAEHVDLPME